MVQSVQLKRGQTHGQGSGPILHTSRRTISHFCDTLKMWNSVGIKSTRILWYLWNWGNQVFCEIFCTNTYTLRLVSPLGCPGNPAYPTAQRGYPMAREHTLLPNTLPSTQQTIIQPREAALQPTDFRRLPYGPEATLRPGDYPYSLPAYPSFRNRHTHGTQHTQSSRKAPGATQTTRLHSQPTESITNNAQRRQIQRIQRKA